MTLDEAKELIKNSTVPPDDIIINGKRWKIECTYLTKKEAEASAEFLMPSDSRIFKYQNGFVHYERDYN